MRRHVGVLLVALLPCQAFAQSTDSTHNMATVDMDDTAPGGSLLLDHLEAFAGKGGHGQEWEAEGWYGNDTDKLWLHSEGERSAGEPPGGDIDLFWSHANGAFWDTQLGVRADIGEGPARTWAAVGVQGPMPYEFEVQATVYAGDSGRTAARLRIEYELQITQRLILQPDLEINAYGKADPRRNLGAGVSSVQGGMRLRYEIRPSIAPYVGIVWDHLTAGTAAIARGAGDRITDRRWVAGIRIWL